MKKGQPFESSAMTRRKELEGIIHDFTASFVSRNNDIHGYWGIGKLYKLAINNKTAIVEIDLLSKKITPKAPNLNLAVTEMSISLFKKLEKLRLPKPCLTQAIIKLEFEQAEDESKPFARYMGAPFTCTMTTTDDLGRVRTTSLQGRSHPHDPSRESQRSRFWKT